MRVYIETYGCALNRADTAIMKSLLKERGHTIVDSMSSADVIVINTCTVRLDTEQRILKRLSNIRNFSNGRKIVITGCMVSAQPYTLTKVVPEASLVSPQNITYIVDAVEHPKRLVLVEGIRDVSFLHPYVDGATASIPIAEGCLGSCSYCIVKIARRRLRSYKPGIIVNAVEEAVKSGAIEIDLTAQDTGAYGVDLPNGPRLPELVSRVINEVHGNYMVRIGMMNPDTIEDIIDELIEVLKHPKVFKYVHLPLQSASDKVLRIMKRKYTYDQYRDIIKEIRRKVPEVSIATDIIVGHPGEEWDDFLLTLESVKELMPDKVHIAQYTIRPRTEAASMKQVPDPEKKKRSSILTKVVEEIGLKINRVYIGALARTWVTSISIRGSLIGRTVNYKPVVIMDNGQNVRLGDVVIVRVKNVSFFDLRGYTVGSL